MPDIFVSNTNKNPPTKKIGNTAPEFISQKGKHLNHPSLLTSFCDAPNTISFTGQEKDEKVLLFLRRHLITNFAWVVSAIIFILLPIVFFIVVHIANFSFLTLPFRYLLVLTIFYYLIVLSYIFVNFISWYYNIFLVTQKRIVDLDYSNLVYHESSVTKIGLIQDISHSRSGFLASFFNYGDLLVQTAGNEPNLEAYSIPKPSKAAQIITDLIGNHRGRRV